jgi:hypothetical protein
MTSLEKWNDVSKDDASKKVSTTTSDVENILLYKNKFFLALEEKFGDICDVTQREASGNHKICLLTKGLEKKTQEQVVITVTKTWKINVNLNPYDHYDEYYFLGEKLTDEEVMNEMDNFSSFLQAWKVSEGSKLVKEMYPWGDDDLTAYMAKK